MSVVLACFFFKGTGTTEIYTYGHTLSLHDALPIYEGVHLGEPFTGLEHRKAGEGGERDAAKHRRRPHRGGGLMTGRPSWDEVTAARTQSPERQIGRAHV